MHAERFSPHNFGIPQIRERVYILGSLEPIANFQWPKTNDADTCIDSVLDDHPKDAKKLSGKVLECMSVWDEFLKACPKDVQLPSFPLWSMEWGSDLSLRRHDTIWLKDDYGIDGLLGFKGSHGVATGRSKSFNRRWESLPSHARTEQRDFPKWKKDFIRQNRQFYLDNASWIDPWLTKILKFPSSLQKLEWNVHGGERDIWKYVVQFRASGVRIKRRTTAPSLIAMTDTQVPIIAWQKRYMTPRECAKLQKLRYSQGVTR